MKNLSTLTLIFIFALSAIFVQAQPCTPGTFTTSGIYPDSIPGIPKAYVNIPYSSVITVVVPTDTVMFGNTLSIDSIGVVSVTGLPAGFTYSTNPNNGFIQGGTSGCVLLSGTATLAQIGSYPLNITLQSWVNAIPTGFTDVRTGYYTLVISDTIVGLKETENMSMDMICFPNPFSNGFTVTFGSPVEDNAYIKVENNLGQIVYKEAIKLNKGSNTYYIQRALPSGIYNVKLEGSTFSRSTRIIASH